MTIQERLFAEQDKPYAAFQAKLIPTIAPETIIGVRTPVLRKLAKELAAEKDVTAAFLQQLPHEYFDENQLHVFLVSGMKEFDVCIQETERMLPYVDNWATCDQFSPKVFKKHRQELLTYIRKWLNAEHPYTVRFAVGMLMEHFLDDAFSEDYTRMVAAVRSEEYYIIMMQAWYFATALAKQYDAVLPFLEQKMLDTRTHNLTIRKAIESNRISPEQKTYLRTLKR